MAGLDIDIRINGEEKLKNLDKTINDIDGSSSRSLSSITKWTVGITAVGVAVYKTLGAGAEWLKQLEETNNTIVKTVDLENSLADSFGMVGGAILENTGAWELYRETLISVGNVLDAIAGKEAILARARKEHIEDEKYYQELLKAKTPLMKENAKALAEEAKALDEANRALARYNGQQQQKVEAHKEQIEILKELIYIYEEQGRSTDELVAKLEKMEATDVLATKSIREKAEALAQSTKETEENTEAIEENTDSVDANTDEVKQNTGAIGSNTSARSKNKHTSGGAGSGEVGTGPYAVYIDPQAQAWDLYLREIAESTRDTNDAVRGY